ncbi:MAG: hypothetical protein HUU60_11695 [Armatimonadetes bacterium]|nr:hypothetical protein [Armatimonadota bacterium]
MKIARMTLITAVTMGVLSMGAAQLGRGGDYLVGNLPVVTDTPAIVWTGPSDEVWSHLVLTTQPGKARRALKRTGWNDVTQLRSSVDQPGARIFLIDTLQTPKPLLERMNEAIGGRMDLTRLPKAKAGYRVMWQYLQPRKPNQLWIVVYAPGDFSIQKAIERCWTEVAYSNKKPLESRNEWDVKVWTAVVDPEAARVPAVREWIEGFVNQRRPELDWKQIAPGQTFENSHRLENSNQIYFLTRDGAARATPTMRNIIGSQYAAFEKTAPNEYGILGATMSNGHTIACLSVPSADLWVPALARFGKAGYVGNTTVVKDSVPDLRGLRRMAVVIDAGDTGYLPKNAVTRIMGELRQSFRGVRMLDKGSAPALGGITEVDQIARMSPAEVSEMTQNAEALLFVRLKSVDRKAEWEYTPYRTPGEPILSEKDAIEPYTNPERLEVPRGYLESRPELDRERGERMRQWKRAHEDWMRKIERLETNLASRMFQVSRVARAIEEVEIEIVWEAIDLRAGATFGHRIEPLTIDSAKGKADKLLHSIPQGGQSRARLVREHSGFSPFDHDGERYFGWKLKVEFEDPYFDPLPNLPPMNEASPASNAMANAVRDAYRQAAQRALLR